MKNTFIYYLAIFVPLIGLIYMAKSEHVSSGSFALSLLFYALIYRTWTDGVRLVQKGVIGKKDIIKLLIPGWHFRYFKELYLS